MHVFRLSWHSAGYTEEFLDEVADLVPQTARISLASQLLQLFLMLSEDGAGATETVEGCLGLVVATFHARGAVAAGDNRLLGQAHSWLEEIVAEGPTLGRATSCRRAC